jgi:hypothetical protein
MKRGVRYTTDPRSEWNRRWSQKRPGPVTEVLFQDLLANYLPKSSELTCLEIGAVPGSFLAYFSVHHGYQIVGLDFADAEHLFHETMRLNGINLYEYINADFVEYSTDRRFDVVTSFGFVEHFDDYSLIVRRHCELVAEGGYVVIGMPNFRYFQFLYHSIFDRDNLDIHNLESMDPAAIHALLVRLGFQRVFSGYWGGLELWVERAPRNVLLRLTERGMRELGNLVGRWLPNSRFYSPYMLMIYRRPAVA